MTPAVFRLRAGDVELDHVGGDVRRVTWRGVEIVRRLHAVARDTAWGTPALEVGDVRSAPVAGGEGSVLTWRADHTRAGLGVGWEGRLEVRPHRITYAVTATALDDVEVNRLGIVVLHPLRQVGAPVATGTGAGPLATTTLPRLVASQWLGPAGPTPAFGPFDRLVIEDGDVRLRMAFVGDLFETEDQRNWLDASFKTYSTPLARPRPRHLAAGERVTQGVRIDVEPAPDNAEAAPLPAGFGDQPREAGATGVGALVPDVTRPPGDADLAALAAAGLGHLRAEVRLADGDEEAALHALADRARRAGLATHVALLAGPATRWEAVARLARGGVDLVLAFEDDDAPEAECTGPATFARLAAALGEPAAAGGGTTASLCEFQRHDVRHLPVGAFALVPTVHADDAASVRQTLESIPAVVATARTRTGGRPLALGPVSGRQRPPSACGRPLPPGGLRPDLLPPEWLAGLVEALAAAGVEAVCTLDVDALVAGGELTEHGRALARALAAEPSAQLVGAP